MTFVEFAHAVAIVESGDNPQAWGDQGLAMGRWQQHPAFTLQWFPPQLLLVRSSWDEVEREALRAFWLHYSHKGEDPLKIAMRFHLGVKAVNDGGWDTDYAQRFQSVAGLVEVC